MIYKQCGTVLHDYGLNCWIKGSDWRVVESIFIVLSLAFHCFAMIYLCFKKRQKHCGESTTHQYNIMLKNYFRFIVVYFVLWIGTIFTQVWAVTRSNEPPIWISILTNINMASTGIGNGIAWCINKYSDRGPKMSELKKKELLAQLHPKRKRIGINNGNNDSKTNNESLTSTVYSTVTPAVTITQYNI